MLTVYVDDSGRGQEPALVLTGYVASPDTWETFAREWREELSVPPAVRYFKMKEAAGKTGEFAGHRPELVKYRLSKLVELIEKHVVLGITSMVFLRAFHEIVVPKFEAESDHPLAGVNTNPYFFSFYDVIGLLHNFL